VSFYNNKKVKMTVREFLRMKYFVFYRDWFFDSCQYEINMSLCLGGGGGCTEKWQNTIYLFFMLSR
jgi:hypothetical protein